MSKAAPKRAKEGFAIFIFIHLIWSKIWLFDKKIVLLCYIRLTDFNSPNEID